MAVRHSARSVQRKKDRTSKLASRSHRSIVSSAFGQHQLSLVLVGPVEASEELAGDTHAQNERLKVLLVPVDAPQGIANASSTTGECTLTRPRYPPAVGRSTARPSPPSGGAVRSVVDTMNDLQTRPATRTVSRSSSQLPLPQPFRVLYARGSPCRARRRHESPRASTFVARMQRFARGLQWLSDVGLPSPAPRTVVRLDH